MKSTRIKELKALRFKVLLALESSLVTLRNRGQILFSSPHFSSSSLHLCCLLSPSVSLRIGLSLSVRPSVCREHTPQLTSGLPCKRGRKGPALSLHMPKVLTKLYALITTSRNCYQMQFEYLVSLLTLQWRLWTAARGGVRGSLFKT